MRKGYRIVPRPDDNSRDQRSEVIPSLLDGSYIRASRAYFILAAPCIILDVPYFNLDRPYIRSEKCSYIPDTPVSFPPETSSLKPSLKPVISLKCLRRFFVLFLMDEGHGRPVGYEAFSN